jgi:uncharacterized protein YabE (DUF348 family)
MRKKLRHWSLRLERYRRVRLPRRIRKVKKASRHPFAVPIITLSTLILLTAVGLLTVHITSNKHPVVREHPYVVIITHDGVRQVVPSIEPTVGALLSKLNIKLNQGDVVEPSATTRINEDKFRINIYRALPVEVVEGSQNVFTFSAATTPRSIAAQAGLNLYPEDELTSSESDNFLAGGAIGQVIDVKPSVPINLILYGAPVATRSHSNTIAELLKEKHIVLQKGDTVQPSLASPVTAGENVFILHAGTMVTTSEQPIPEPVQDINDPTLTTGTSAVRQAGSPGVELITYEVNSKTGVKTQFESVEIQAPVTEIIAKGTAPIPESSSLSNWLATLRGCESGGNYAEDTGNGYYGAYQFSESTWERLGYSGYPYEAAPSTQDQAIVKNTNESSGGLATQNPGCYEKTGISAFPPSD